MEIDVSVDMFYVTINWSSIDQYQSIPINWLVSIYIYWLIWPTHFSPCIKNYIRCLMYSTIIIFIIINNCIALWR